MMVFTIRGIWERELCGVADGDQSVSNGLFHSVCDLFDMFNYVMLCQQMPCSVRPNFHM